MRGRLIFKFLADLCRLDTHATATTDPDGAGTPTGGYDPDFKEAVVVDHDDDGIGERVRFLFALLRKAGKEPTGGSGKGIVVVTIPARPFLRPAFKVFEQGVQKRFLGRVAALMGWSSGPTSAGAGGT